MHIDTINPDYINNPTRNNNPGYVVYFGGTNFTDYLSETRNGAFNECSWSFCRRSLGAENHRHRSIPTVTDHARRVQPRWDGRANIGSDLKSKGLQRRRGHHLGIPVITSPSTSYHTLHMTPTGDKVGDDPTLNTISPLWPPFADSYHKQAGDAGQGYEVDLGKKATSMATYPSTSIRR